MRAKTLWVPSAILLLGVTAATAQSFPCASVAPEVRERVREAGACRDATPEEVALKGAPPPSSAVTMTLSDGTVVRIPLEISSSINDGRKHAASNETAKPKGAPRAPAQSKPGASGDPAPAPQKLAEPDASSADTTPFTAPVTAPATADATSPTLAPATNPTVASAATSAAAPVPVSELTVPPEPRGRFPIAFPANAAFILGAGMLLGLLFGALLMRQWLLRRKPVADGVAAPPTSYQHPLPVETGAGGVSETGAAPEIRFAAHLYPGETTIVLAPLPGGDEVAVEQSSHHA
jgi:hypothetical protein